jgi:hypothetical protein
MTVAPNSDGHGRALCSESQESQGADPNLCGQECRGQPGLACPRLSSTMLTDGHDCPLHPASLSGGLCSSWQENLGSPNQKIGLKEPLPFIARDGEHFFMCFFGHLNFFF